MNPTMHISLDHVLCRLASCNSNLLVCMCIVMCVLCDLVVHEPKSHNTNRFPCMSTFSILRSLCAMGGCCVCICFTAEQICMNISHIACSDNFLSPRRLMRSMREPPSQYSRRTRYSVARGRSCSRLNNK